MLLESLWNLLNLLRGCDKSYAQEHIDSLLPNFPPNERKCLSDFTKTWLHDDNTPWPPSADTRLCRWMHATEIYATPHPEQMEALVKHLVSDTEIEHPSPFEKKSFEKRVLERITHHAQIFLDKGLIGRTKGKLGKTSAFKKLWDAPNSGRAIQSISLTSPRLQMSRITNERPDPYDVENLLDKNSISNKRKLGETMSFSYGRPDQDSSVSQNKPGMNYLA